MKSTPLLLTGLISLGLASGITSCRSKLLQQADEKYNQYGEYMPAADLYREARTNATKPEEKAYATAQIAECYRRSNQIAKADTLYKSAIDQGYNVDSINFFYGQALAASGQYDAATAQFENVSKTATNPTFAKRAQEAAENTPKIKAIVADTKKNEYLELAAVDSLNTTGLDYVLAVGKSEFFLTSNRDGGKTFDGAGVPFTKLYSGEVTKTGQLKLSTLKALEDEINKSGTNVGNAAISPDGKTLVFARGNDGDKKGAKNVDLFIMRKRDGKWQEPEIMSVSDPIYWDACPAFSPDGKSLYFASDRPGGKGGSDIYRVQQDPNGRFTKLSNLGDPINTAGDESFPSVSADGKLYFSSNGHPSIGNLDIFVATRKDNKTEVDNLGVPFNSVGDDFGISFKSNTDGYFTSNRAGGKGEDDIYSFHDSKNDPRIIKFDLRLLSQEREDKTNVLKPLGNAKLKLSDEKGKVLGNITTDSTGKATLQIAPVKMVKVFADKQDFYAKRDSVSLVGKAPDPMTLKPRSVNVYPVDIVVSLDRIKKGQTFKVDNIYYAFNSADINDTAATELDKVVTFLSDNPAITIELSSHTDSRGKAVYNQKLSQRRAESAVAYIVGKGVDAKRITAKGYGATKNIVPNAATEEEHALNRRTEIKILKYDRSLDQ